MEAAIECEGAPRDLGLDQGRACAELLGRRFGSRSRWERMRLWAGAPTSGAARLALELRRHFPHQSESVAGLAVGAGVPQAWLVGELAAELAGASPPPLAVAVGGAQALLGLALEGSRIVRRCRPEGLFASVELTRPWLAASLAGVNEEGLAVAVVPAGGDPPGRGAPAALLAQDCLERFGALEAALEWCLGRPGSGRATLLLAQADSGVAAVEFSGSERRVLRPSEGCIAAGGDSGRAAELGKALRDLAPTGAAVAARLGPGAVVVDSAARRLTLGGVGFSP